VDLDLSSTRAAYKFTYLAFVCTASCKLFKPIISVGKASAYHPCWGYMPSWPVEHCFSSPRSEFSQNTHVASLLWILEEICYLQSYIQPMSDIAVTSKLCSHLIVLLYSLVRISVLYIRVNAMHVLIIGYCLTKNLCTTFLRNIVEFFSNFFQFQLSFRNKCTC